MYATKAENIRRVLQKGGRSDKTGEYLWYFFVISLLKNQGLLPEVPELYITVGFGTFGPYIQQFQETAQHDTVISARSI